MKKVWLKSYPKDVPHEINPDIHESIVEVLENSAQQFGAATAFCNFGTCLSFQDVLARSRDFAAYLQQILQLKKGDRVAIMLPNILQYPVAMFGALSAGCTVVNVNPLYTAHELIAQLKDSGAETIIVMENFAATVAEALPETQLKNIIVTKMGDLFPLPKSLFINFILKYVKKAIPTWHIPQAIKFSQLMRVGKKLQLAKIAITRDDIAFLQYTGGTTGVAKGAMLTHRNMVANIEQTLAWVKPTLKIGEEVIITALPLYHIFSLLTNCLLFLKLGGKNILITNPRDIPGFVKELSTSKFTVLTGVNTLFNALLKNSAFTKLDFHLFKLGLGGGTAVQEAVAEKWQKITGKPLLEGYGLTEASPVVAIEPIDLQSYTGAIGLPVPSTDVCILDEDQNELPYNQPGELAVKGPQVMRGYWQNPGETKKVFTADGWLLTGDIATIDEDGFIRVVDRKKDMILVSGFNVYPNELEEVIAKIPGVVEVAVVGVPDESSGEAPKAFIVKDNPNLSEADVLKLCHQVLTGYKVPKYIEFRSELPKTTVGKVLRRALRTAPAAATKGSRSAIHRHMMSVP